MVLRVSSRLIMRKGGSYGGDSPPGEQYPVNNVCVEWHGDLKESLYRSQSIMSVVHSALASNIWR